MTPGRWVAIAYRAMQALAAACWAYAVVKGWWDSCPGWIAVFMIAGHLADHQKAKEE